ncbi:hypothetical protein EDC94DRAFT_595047 [Helicostylum pulchrum]|nr:hypothetical protein EDC94DRAFT_595047 [Helicostylum pulchrum]
MLKILELVAFLAFLLEPFELARDFRSFLAIHGHFPVKLPYFEWSDILDKSLGSALGSNIQWHSLPRKILSLNSQMIF